MEFVAWWLREQLGFWSWKLRIARAGQLPYVRPGGCYSYPLDRIRIEPTRPG